MPIDRRAFVFILLIMAGVVSSFSASGAVTAGWLWLWLGLSVWLAMDTPVWSKSALPNLMLVFLLWIAVSVWWSQSAYSSWYSVQILSAIPIGFLAWQLTPGQDFIWAHLKKLFIVGVWLVSLWGIYQVAFLGFPRALGPVADPNVYACLLNMAWFPLLSSFFNSGTASKERSHLIPILLGVSLLLVGLAFFAASSRGATLAWLLLMPVALWAFRHLPNFRKKAFVSLSIALASYFIMSAIAHSNLMDRASANFLEQDASVFLRLLMWRTTGHMFAAHPWLGSGLGTWGGLYPAYRQAEDNSTAGYYAHNDYLQIAQEGGAITFALFMLIFFFLVLLFVRAVFTSKNRPNQIENAGLMLGVMAAYLHASVNFIFYLIYLNIFVGLYAARAWQSSMLPQRAGLALSTTISPVMRRIVILFVFSIPVTQIMLHEASEIFLNGNSRTLTLLRKQFPQLTPFDIARFIAAVRPQEYIAQRYLVDSAAQSLSEIDPHDLSLKQEILQETIERYDQLRLNSVNSAEIGAAEADLILEYRDLMPGNSAIHQARLIARAALETDPRHVASIIALARSYFLEGNQSVGNSVLSGGVSNMIFLRDRLILQAELLKQLIPSGEMLSKIQENLKNIKFACEVGDCLGNRSIEKEQEARLYGLANSIMPISDPVVKKALISLVNKEEQQ